jgi:hypothetical protein
MRPDRAMPEGSEETLGIRNRMLYGAAASTMLQSTHCADLTASTRIAVAEIGNDLEVQARWPVRQSAV